MTPPLKKKHVSLYLWVSWSPPELLATGTPTENDMTEKFRALVVTKNGDRRGVEATELTDADLMDGDVTVAVEHSTVNYKDGLAITGKVPIIRKFPLIPGVDLAGRVLRSEDPRFQTGDRVVVNGYGLGEVHHGGYAERARIKGDWLIRLPETISTIQAMAIGTAGYTAMLCVLALEKAGVMPDRGAVLVTGAAGGVGSIAIALLNKLGYRVVASSRRAKQEADYLWGLGAHATQDGVDHRLLCVAAYHLVAMELLNPFEVDDRNDTDQEIGVLGDIDRIGDDCSMAMAHSD